MAKNKRNFTLIMREMGGNAVSVNRFKNVNVFTVYWFIGTFARGYFIGKRHKNKMWGEAYASNKMWEFSLIRG